MAVKLNPFSSLSLRPFVKAYLGKLSPKSDGFRVILRTMSTQQKLNLRGIYPPIPTAFDSNEDISYEKMEYNLKKWDTIPFKGYTVQGSNGEYAYMTYEERVEMVRRVREIVPKSKLIIAGSGCESTRDTITLSQKMAAVGADAVLVVTPCYYKNGMTDLAMEKHYTAVADNCPVPVILYSCPGNTGINLSGEVVIKLAKHPNIIGFKDSGGDVAKLGNIVHKTAGQDFHVIAGSASFLLPALAVGCSGGICALANVVGQEVCDVQTLFEQGQQKEALTLQHRLIVPNTDVTRKYGVPGMKAAMEWYGYYGGPTRSPLQPLSEEDVNKIKKDFQDNGLL
ncbi:4-hydroxy-2-oxoglutarate aldolase, mitochondrial [Lingula anatina]|uniref:4-hydroxy-2-oxoglutarate aldolase, mitochondrial n=1 Tax=Lingula anatina TaxID=7574 RepID=A0A1S3J847_LINAN|nr:4-hydroxy-2-oxoglutarate aldolase, mitochondrial [Lingula anatina]|eukprot:XP_013406488.1 4-hydroxy-2-oxoglutarate aldolase, mitochondrial [Lingula anatina]